ncbi:MAG: alpha/beta fold hydrolase [Candidatus Lokiarchaeota archaeon]|nr:alpha/beta fold hydrolase [Candidatus Lokiarchaeota archaeon]
MSERATQAGEAENGRQPLSRAFLGEQGYDAASVDAYYAMLARFRGRYHPTAQQAPDPRELYIEAPDGSSIFVQEFIPEHPKAVVIGQPGNNCQSDLYYPLADHLFPASIGLVAVDNRGHGRSGPGRGRFDKPSLMFPVYDALVERFAAAGVPVHVLGESLGTTMFASYIANGSPASKRVASAIFLVPPYKLRRQRLFTWIKWFAKLLLWVTRAFTLDRAVFAFNPDLRPTYFPEYHEIDLGDIIRAPKSSAIHLLAVLGQLERFHANAKAITIPLLVLAGTGDKDLDPAGAEQLARETASSNPVLHVYENADHSLMFDVHSQGSYAEIALWVGGGWRERHP